MKQQSSLTAEGIALLRAMESAKPANERVCYDPYARYFVSRWLSLVAGFFMRIGYAEKRGPGVEGYLVARTRCIDDYLQACLDNGIEQLVILGAGFDSRAYRFSSLVGRVKVFEVDHPATQRAKLARLEKIFGSIPSHVVYVPIDFERAALDQRLRECGYDERLKTLFVWEGVTMYLTPEAVDSTLEFVAHHSGAGSSIIFDYVYAGVIRGTVKRGEMASMQRNARWTGEAMKFGVEEGTIVEFLTKRGFSRVENADHAALQQRYFTGVNAKRKVAPVYAIVHASVG